ncbi:GMC family oxidoreductase N-terminal domain-containing protein [Deinococcus sp. KNUC1210]|uniref:GMC family oxidoreductase n=1 Tax=Deinococcus sp. KNUC1210 TaxID=2917691 RepID=UPI001EF07547|nr:GMC family oxidoreductase N-terminal domain-containing protein [Deinococcus sp. KNUC1210]ULH15724.1 GMC family oxidoreductase N-terminal domain-containing protein [Deinococcus sp. KNUC1210]
MNPDYVVVGAGAGGCVVARRLLDAGRTVLLIEAGGSDNHLFVTAPAAFSRLFRSRFDWAFLTEPQEHLNGRRLYWPRGKVLGGSTAINATIYIRGSQHDFAGWGDGWSWNDVLPAYQRIERFSGGESATRGGSGELPVGHRQHGSHDLSRRFVEAAAHSLHLSQPASFNDGTLEGAGLFESNHLRGERWSAFRAFLKPKLNDPKLTVLTHAQATRLLWDGTRAAGVQFLHQGRLKEVRTGGVILAGGAVQTPHLLMLSGAGPGDELRRHGLKVQTHLPGVGQNLQDHPATAMIFRSKLPSLDAQLNDLAALPYLLNRSGALTTNVAEAGAFVRSNAALDVPDLQYHFAPAFFREHGFQKEKGAFFSLGPVLVAPQSRGSITLGNADPLAAPRIDPRYLSDERDLTALVSGLKLAREIAAAHPLSEARGAEYLPGEQDLSAYVRREVETLYHPVGTCALGDDDASVVSKRLAVHGTEALWVADASVMPRIIHANTNATTMMIGERAAQFILQDTP